MAEVRGVIWGALLGLLMWLAMVAAARAQVTAPDQVVGGVYRSALPTYSDQQRSVFQTDANGRLIVSGAGGTWVLGAGTAIIGKVGIDQTTPGTTNGVQVNAALPAGANVIGHVIVDTTSTTAVTQATAANLNATVQPGNTANTTPWLMQTVGQATGGISVFSKQVANNTTSFAVDASAGTLYGIYGQANSATIAYIKLYNAAQGSVTCGSGTPVDRVMIPASTSGAGFILPIGVGVAYSTAITACVTTGFADNDTTAPAANAYQISFYYK